MVRHPELLPKLRHSVAVLPAAEQEPESSTLAGEVSSGKVPQVELAHEQIVTVSADALVETEMFVHSIFGLELSEVKEAMEVASLEVLPAPANVLTDVVQSSELTRVLAPELEPGKVALSPEVVTAGHADDSTWIASGLRQWEGRGRRSLGRLS